jgi:hypothetical protein
LTPIWSFVTSFEAKDWEINRLDMRTRIAMLRPMMLKLGVRNSNGCDFLSICAVREDKSRRGEAHLAQYLGRPITSTRETCPLTLLDSSCKYRATLREDIALYIVRDDTE